MRDWRLLRAEVQQGPLYRAIPLWLQRNEGPKVDHPLFVKHVHLRSRSSPLQSHRVPFQIGVLINVVFSIELDFQWYCSSPRDYAPSLWPAATPNPLCNSAPAVVSCLLLPELTILRGGLTCPEASDASVSGSLPRPWEGLQQLHIHKFICF